MNEKETNSEGKKTALSHFLNGNENAATEQQQQNVAHLQENRNKQTG